MFFVSVSGFVIWFFGEELAVDPPGGGGDERGICASGWRIVAMVLSSFARCNCVL